MEPSSTVEEPQLERQGQRLARPAWRFLALALILLSSIPGVVGIGLLTSSSVARWAARHKLFA